MNHLTLYETIEKVFITWCNNYFSNGGKIRFQEDILTYFYNDIKHAYKLVPMFQTLEEFDEDGFYIYRTFNDDEVEIMLKYFHDNPNVWEKYLEK